MSIDEAVRCVKSMLSLEDPRAGDVCLGLFRSLKGIEACLDTQRVGYSTEGLREDIRDGDLKPTTFVAAKEMRVSLTMGREAGDALGPKNGINRPHIRVAAAVLGEMVLGLGEGPTVMEILNFAVKLESDLKPVLFVHIRKPVGDALAKAEGVVTMSPGLFNVGSMITSEEAHLDFDRVQDQDAIKVLNFLLGKFTVKVFKHFLELLLMVFEWRGREIPLASTRRSKKAAALLDYAVELTDPEAKKIDAGAWGAMLGTILAIPQSERDLLVSKIPGRSITLKNAVDT